MEVEEDRMEMEKRMRVGVRKNINFIDVRMKDVIEEGRCQQSFLDTGCRSK